MSLKISRKIFSFSGIGAAYYQHHPITRFYSANVFSAMRRSLSPLLGSSMAFSSPSIATKSAANPDVDSENEKKIVTIGQFYQDMLFRGRKVSTPCLVPPPPDLLLSYRII